MNVLMGQSEGGVTEASAFPISSPELLAVVPRPAAEENQTLVRPSAQRKRPGQTLLVLTHNALSVEGGCVVVGGGGCVEAVDFGAMQRVVLGGQRKHAGHF